MNRLEKEINQEVDRLKSIPNAFLEISKKIPKNAVYSQAEITESDTEENPRKWFSHSFQEVQGQVLKVSNFLIQKGLKKGDSVAIISYTRPEWMIADIAILMAGGISVSVYQSLTADVIAYILNDSSSKFIFAENQEQVDKIIEISSREVLIPEVEDRPEHSVQLSFKAVVVFEEFDSRSHDFFYSYSDILSSKETEIIPPVLEEITPDCVASYVYTSGTTGPPKGVIQTHRNHLANVIQASRTDLFEAQGSIFLFLPLAHSFAKLVGYLGFLLETELKFPAISDRRSSVLNAPSVLRDMREGSAGCVPLVPRILEKLLAGVRQKSNGSSFGAKLLSVALKSAEKNFSAKRDNVSLDFATFIQYLLTKPIRKKVIKKLFGPGFKHCVSGGAKLPEQVSEFFSGLGVDIYEGYGLTETCVATNVNPLGRIKIGSVGPVLDGITLKILDDGEIVFRGPNITSGYHNRPEATKESYDSEGWFYTGDLGRLDEENFLFIVGRKKDIIVTAGGKNIAPQPIEEKISFSEYISHCAVFGDGKPYCVALVTLEEDAVRQKLNIKNSGNLSKEKSVIDLIKAEIDIVNTTLNKYETIKKFVIIDTAFTVENEYLTPSFKLKKKKVFTDFKNELESLYA